MGKNKQESSSTTTSNPWDPAIPHLENILNQADKLFNEQGGINKEWIDKEIADLTPDMQNMINQAINNPKFQEVAGAMQNAATSGAAGLGQGQGMLGGLAQQGVTGKDINELASELYDSDMVNAQKEQIGKDVSNQLGKAVQGINQGATASGGMGSSRAGVMEGVATGKAADAIASGSAAVENAARQQAYGQALGTLQGNQNTALGAAGQLTNSGLGSLGVLGNLGNLQLNQTQQGLGAAGIGQSHQQNIANNNWFNAQGQQNAGWDALSKYLGIAGSIGGMGGTSNTTGTTSTGSNPWNTILGAGATAGGIMSGLGAMGFSDASLKKKVKRKGKTKDGINKYDWEWNESAKKKIGKSGKESGVLAQDVAKKNPDAVSRDQSSGALMVDYDKTGVKRGKKKS
ncbi:MAG: hypothetical protein ACRDCE_10225 [Cetobacterium sp.]|uniref:hypothetical protein n=1 Tax=Cetobacterium sp. TaxID=2071632 RepID=UPI003EE6762B